MVGGLKKRLLGKRPTWLKLAFFILIAVLFSYGPFYIFASVPLTLVYLLYGWTKLSSVCLGVAIAAATFAPMVSLPYSPLSFAGAYFLAVCIAESIMRKIQPVRALLYSGGLIVVAVVVLVCLALFLSDKGPRETVEIMAAESTAVFKEHNREFLGGDMPEMRAIKELLDNPTKIADMMMRWSFVVLFIGVFFGLWIGFLMVLHNSFLWRHMHSYPYSYRNLLAFRLDDRFAYVLILGLALCVGSYYLDWGKASDVVGTNILWCLAVLYFFQGFGIYWSLLDHLKIFGVLRVAFVVLMLMTVVAWQLLVVVGIFDVWMNFRRFFKPKKMKKSKGDKL